MKPTEERIGVERNFRLLAEQWHKIITKKNPFIGFCYVTRIETGTRFNAEKNVKNTNLDRMEFSNEIRDYQLRFRCTKELNIKRL